MKKIFITIFCVLLVSGCNKNEEQTKKEVIFSKTVTEAKEYYVSKVAYINHDDYFKEEENENNNELVVQTSNYYESKEAVEVLKNEVVLENEIISKKEEENNEEDVKNKSEVIAKESVVEETLETKVIEDNLIIEEEKEELVLENKEALLSSSEPILLEDEKIIEPKTNEEIKETVMTSDVIKEEIEVPLEVKTGYYSPNGKYLGETKVKVIDVSYYQGDINWDVFARESDCYGVILRLGYYDTLDKKFERNISELKRLNIPYGIYLFSYATTLNGSNKEANFTNQMIDKYNLEPTLGIYYDIESWNASNGASSNDINKQEYDIIISNYISNVSTHIDNKYKVKVYSGRWYAMNRLGPIAKSYVDWVAEYNSTLKYDSSYTMWQYTSKGNIPGINGNVDISYLY